MARIAVTYNLVRNPAEDFDFDTNETIDYLHKTISRRHTCMLVEVHRDIPAWTAELIKFRPDLVFNVAEGYRSPAREAFYPSLFEQLDLKYTGPGPTEMLVCLNKSLTKSLLKHLDVSLLSGCQVSSLADIDGVDFKCLEGEYPLIVKLNAEGSSLGIDDDSVVNDKASLCSQVELCLKRFPGRALLIEKFLDGYDLAISFVEGLGYFGPVLYKLPKTSSKNIQSFRLKAFDYDEVEVVRDTTLPDLVSTACLSAAARVREALNIRGYCRFDFRVGVDEIPYLLEVNAQVSFDPEHSFSVAVAKGGIEPSDLVEHVINYWLDRPREDSTILSKQGGS